MPRTTRIVTFACFVGLASQPASSADLRSFTTSRPASGVPTPAGPLVAAAQAPAPVNLRGASALLQEAPPQFVLKFGMSGRLPGQFYDPSGMDTDAEGNLYVCDRANNRIQKFDPDGRFLMQIGSSGSLPEALDLPQDLALDDEGNIYVAEPYRDRIHVFGPDGRLLRVFSDYFYDFDLPLAVDLQNNQLFVLDAGRGTVRIFDRYGQVPPPSNQRAEFRVASPNESGGLAVSPQSDVYVVNVALCVITKYDWAGRKLLEWGGEGTGPSQFARPGMGAIDVDPWGNVYVTDRTLDRVQKFDANGNFLSMWGSAGDGDGQFQVLNGITVNGQGRIFVNQLLNPRIQVFAYTVQVESTTWSRIKAKFR